MKNIKSVILFFIIILFSSCFRDVIHGTGEVIQKSRALDNVTGIAVNIPAQIELTGNTAPSMVVVAQENLHDEIITRIDGSMLVITSKADIAGSEPIIIKLGVDELSILELNGSASLKTMNKITSKSLDIELTGSGDLSLEIDADLITAMVAGSGGITLNGNTDEFKSQINGSGNINAAGLKSTNVYTTINGSGEIKIYADQSLKANINGSGNVTCNGPAEVISNINGSGKVIKK